MKVFVTGATGATGQLIVQQLIEQGMTVRALVRDLETARKMLPATTDLVEGSILDSLAVNQAIADCHVIICAAGARAGIDVTGPYWVDYEGTKILVEQAQAKNIKHFVLVSSLCVSQFFHPLNLFGLILVWKKQAEEYLQKSGLTYTIVRPGGLRNDASDQPLVMKSADQLFEGSIPRSKVAEVCIEALFSEQAKNKIVEIVCQSDAPQLSYQELFAKVG
jgi:uncharacterized protein YbjT (DUF2867 family)